MMDPDSNTERAQRAVPDFITGLFDENRALRDLAKNPLVVCADGFQMSVQASSETESDPRADGEPIYSSCCVWLPERDHDDLLRKYADCEESTYYGHVPAQVVEYIISVHGGIVSGRCPAGVYPPAANAESRLDIGKLILERLNS